MKWIRNIIFTTTCSIIAISCGLDCIEKKTGLHEACVDINQSKDNKVFKFRMHPTHSVYKIDHKYVFVIKQAWVENVWSYECIDNHAVIIKDSSLQLVLNATFKDDSFKSNYTLRTIPSGLGETYLTGRLDFRYEHRDTFKLLLINRDVPTHDSQILDTLFFIK